MIPLVADGFGDAAEFDDGEFAGEPALEGVDAGADLGEGHGSTSIERVLHGWTG